MFNSCFIGQYEEALIKLSNAESEIEGLKLQIDDALGAEDLLVQLTERNLELGEVGSHHSAWLTYLLLLSLPENRGDANHY